MTALDRLRDELQRREGISWSTEGHRIRIEADSADGFAVELHDKGSEFVVTFGDGWHEIFSDPDEALDCVAFGLSPSCRLRVSRRGAKAYKWTVEYEKEGSWHPDSTTGLLLFPFWKRIEVVYLQNGILGDGS